MMIALRAVRTNTLRSVLTTLGIIIGIVSVTGMATVVSGIERGFERDISSLGTDVVYIERWPWVQDSGTKWWEIINRPNITKDVADALNRHSRTVEAATAVVSTGGPITAGNNSVFGASIRGTTANYPLVHSVELESGYFYSEFDDVAARDVAVIGATIAEELFPITSPLGKDIKVNGHRYRVIGINRKQGQGTGNGSEDREVRVPFNSFKKHFGTRWRDASIRAKLLPGITLEDARDEIRGVVRSQRKLDYSEEDNFEINEQASLRAAIEPIKNAIFAIGIGLTALSLLVGGIGVMNIMFVTVKERTREIGIRKAVGARRSSILTQFLIEAIVICLLGGAIGILFTIPVTLLIKAVLPAYLGMGTVMLAFGICVAIGTIFGLAPAWSAAKSAPIDALRYE